MPWQQGWRHSEAVILQRSDDIMNGAYLANLLFLLSAGAGTLYLLTEAVLQSLGRSLCATEGCKVVSQVSRFGDLSMILLGVGVLSLLVVLAWRGMRSTSGFRDRIINVVLTAALAGEGFLVGYQLFRLHAVCVFCLSVLGIYVVLGLLRILAGHGEVIAGFGALAAVLVLFALVLPAGGLSLPTDRKYVLFFSPDCKHCTEIRKEIDGQGLDVLDAEVSGYAPTLRSLGIDSVPTLMVNGPYEKLFLTGTDAIRTYLAECRAKAAPRSNKRSAERQRTGSPPPAPNPLQLFPVPGSSDQLLSPSSDDGICKENTKCN